MTPSSVSEDCHTATQLPARSVPSWGLKSPPASSAALGSSGAASLQVAPLSVERAKRMSKSEPMLPSRSSVECQATSQLPAPSVATQGLKSPPESAAALELSGSGAFQVAPLLVERAKRMSKSGPTLPSSGLADCQT